MSAERWLRRKWTLRAGGDQIVFVKRRQERAEHVIMKALIWALYLPQYPNLAVEIPVGDRYRPDVVEVDPYGRPIFWGEAGHVSPQKVHALAKRYRRTHFAWAKWAVSLAQLEDLVYPALEDLRREGPFDLITFPPDSAEQFIGDRGEIEIDFEDLAWIRIPG